MGCSFDGYQAILYKHRVNSLLKPTICCAKNDLAQRGQVASTTMKRAIGQGLQQTTFGALLEHILCPFQQNAAVMFLGLACSGRFLVRLAGMRWGSQQ
jgi:hypothetical protein